MGYGSIYEYLHCACEVSLEEGLLPHSNPGGLTYDEIEVQVPPNLSPVEDLLDCGVGDLGGVSPVTADRINPEYEWPELRRLETLADGADKDVAERLPVYERYLDDETGFAAPSVATGRG